MNIEADNYYLCIKTVRMNGGYGREAYTKGKIYHSMRNGHLTDNDSDNHEITAAYAAIHFVRLNVAIEVHAKFWV